MKPGKLDLPTIWRGCDWGPFYLKWKNANGLPINVSAYTPRAQSLNVNLNAQKSLTETGTTTLSLPRGLTLNLKLGTENWDWIWEQRDANGNLIARYPPFLAGKVTIREPVTGVEGDTPPNAPVANGETDTPIINLPDIQ